MNPPPGLTSAAGLRPRKPYQSRKLTAATARGTVLGMAPPLDFSGPFTASALAAQLAAGDVAPCPIVAGPQIVSSAGPVKPANITVSGSTPYAPGSTHQAGHGHPLHAFGSRALASTSGDPISYTVVVADPTEYVKDAASDKIIDDLVFVAGQLYRVHRLR